MSIENNVDRFPAGPDVDIVVDAADRAHWAQFGVADPAAQDRVFTSLGRAVEVLLSDDELPGADTLPQTDTLA